MKFLCTYKGTNNIQKDKIYEGEMTNRFSKHEIYKLYLIKDESGKIVEYPHIWFKALRDINLDYLLSEV